MRDRDELDFFMEHAILSKDLRDLADRARAIRERERGEVASLRLAVLVYEELLVDLGFGECTDRNEAVAIRDRERKLAGLAREMRSWMIESRDCGYFMSDFEIEWLQRMQKELGP